MVFLRARKPVDILKRGLKGLFIVTATAATLVSPRLTVVASASTTKTVTLTSYSTEEWYQSASDTQFSMTKTVTYYDSYTGQTLTFQIPKRGSPKAIASQEQTLTSISNGANMYYDPVDHTRLGYMSNNTTTYWNGAYRYANAPRRPTDYYGPNPDKTGWTLVAIHWADSEPQPASDYPWLTKTPRGYYWVSDGTDGQPVEFNKYRKGVWLKYQKTVRMYEWQQEYQGTVQIPLTKTPPTPPPPPSGPTCPPPTIPPKPPNRVLSYDWSPDGSGGQYLTWTDTNWVLQQRSDGNGCAVDTWVDEPRTYTHDYPLSVNHFQVTGLFYDPGKPGELWSPSNPMASQRNQDAGTDGSTMNGNPALPTFGDPDRSPAVYVRVGGGFAFRLMWTGSPHDMPAAARVIFRIINPGGQVGTWGKTFQLLSATVDNHGDVPVWDPSGQGYPPPATEYGFVYTPIPKYASTGTPTSFSELTVWNLTGDPTTAARLSAAVTFTTASGSSVTWTNSDLAQTLGYPTWYFLHQIPNPSAKYEAVQPSWNESYTNPPLPQLGEGGQFIPEVLTPGS